MEIEEVFDKLHPDKSVNALVKKLEDGGKHLIVEMRTLNPEPPAFPTRMETPPRDHLFYDAEGFVSYLQKFGTPNTVILADQKTGRIEAIIDENSMRGVEVISLFPQIHPRWQPWDALIGKTIPLSAFVDFLRNNRRAVFGGDNDGGRSLLLALSQIRASTEVELCEGSGKNSMNGIMIKTRIQGKESSSLAELPETIKIKTPIFIGEQDVQIEMDLILDTAEGGKIVTARIASADLLEAKIAAFEKIVDLIRGMDLWTVSYGSERRGAWNYLPELKTKTI